MIDRQYANNIIFECDACDETLETGETDWATAKTMFDRDGWKAEKVGSEWTHLCPQCKAKGQQQETKRYWGDD